MRRFHRLSRKWRRAILVVDDSSKLCLGEIGEELAKATGACLPLKNNWAAPHDECVCSLQVCYNKAKQRDEVERKHFDTALKDLASHPDQALIAEETHSDESASRR